MVRKSKGDTKKQQGKPRKQGRQNAFSGVKLEFLDSYKDAFLDSVNDRAAFYNRVASEFIDRFGHDLPIEENPEPDDGNNKHTPRYIDASLSLEEQNLEADRWNSFKDELCAVSHLLHRCNEETDYHSL
jgi:hypothetical protein